MELDIGTGFYQSRSLPLAAQRCINLYPAVPQSGALSQRSLFGCAGAKLVATTGATVAGSNRGAMTMGGVAYFVNGSSLYSLTSDNIVTNLGLIEGSNRVSLANNGQYLVIVSDSKSYAYDNVANTLNQITDPDFIQASTVVFKDGYFVFSAADGSVFFNSALNDPFSYDALDFGTAEINPDKITALHVNHNELFVCGEETIELFQNIGGNGFPFQRIPGANIQKGVYARHSIREFDNTFVFIGGGKNEKPAIWKVTGSSNVQKISTDAIDNEIQKYTENEINDAFGFDFSEGGNFFVGFSFTSAAIPSKTFVFDATTSALAGGLSWHERQSGVTDNRWRVNSIIRFNGDLVVFDRFDGRIGCLDLEVYDEYGDTLLWSKSTRPFYNLGKTSFVSKLELTVEQGVGLTLGQGSDPKVRMDFSDDGGRTFSSELTRSYGKKGVYDIRPVWYRVGSFPFSRVLRFTGTDPVKRNILKLDAELASGY